MLADSGQADPEQLATHLLGANDPEQAATYFRVAAEQAAQTLAFERAAKLYRLALNLSPPDGAERQQLSIALGDALANAGRGAEAGRLYQAAAPGADDRTSLDLLRRSAYQFCISGHLDEGLAVLAAVLEKVGMRLLHSAASLGFLAMESCLAVVSRDQIQRRGARRTSIRHGSTGSTSPGPPQRASACLTSWRADFQARGCLLALRAGEPFRLARAWRGRRHTCPTSEAGRGTRPSGCSVQARKLAEVVPDPYAMGWTDLCEGLANFTNGRWQVALEKLEQAEADAPPRLQGRRLGDRDGPRLYPLVSALLGRSRGMESPDPAPGRRARERGDRYAVTTHSAFCLPMVQLLADDPAQGRKTVADALGEWSR